MRIATRLNVRASFLSNVIADEPPSPHEKLYISTNVRFVGLG
jgi:hypothetical protein